MAIKKAKQSTRLFILIVSLTVLLLCSKFGFDQWVPMNGGKSLWFISGLASLLLGDLIVTPFFTKPADAISYAVAALVSLISVNQMATWNEREIIAYLLILGYLLFVIISAVASISTTGQKNPTLLKISKSGWIISDLFGRPTVIFGALTLFAVLAFHRDSTREMLAIGVAWGFTVGVPIVEIFAQFVSRLVLVWVGVDPAEEVGDVIAYQSPHVFLVRQRNFAPIKFGKLVALKVGDEPSVFGISIGYVGRDEGALLRVLRVATPMAPSDEYVERFSRQVGRDLAVFVEDEKVTEAFSSSPHMRYLKNLVGVVTAESSIETIYFEVCSNSDLEEGRLVETTVNKKKVVYQVLDGLTKEEIVLQKNTYGFARAAARKIGEWVPQGEKFIPAKWLPEMNEPVILKSLEEYTPSAEAVGHFPNSNYKVNIRSVGDLVTHNTAILGILGVGKSMLAMELAERMMAEGIKVICIDLTNQYAIELKEFYDAKAEAGAILDLKKIGSAGKTNCKQNVEEGGSKREFTKKVRELLSAYLDPDDQRKLQVFNPSQFEVWRQDSKMFNNVASMVSLSPAEITQIISEAALEACQALGMTDRARVCLIYEEAHSLVPEWNSVVADGDKSATNGTARSILQGRKYGMGCLLITQRTANVTKTILNQCHNVFALRTYDDTGKDFLANYFGSDYAGMLSSIPERHAVFFGKASSCESPVYIRLNDRDRFIGAFRKKRPVPIRSVAEEVDVK